MTQVEATTETDRATPDADSAHTTERQRQLATVLDATSDFVLLVAPSGVITWANLAAQRSAAPGTTLTGRNIRDLLRGNDVERYEREVTPALLAVGAWSGEFDIVTASERAMIAAVSFSAHRRAGGDIEFLSVTCRDIAEMKEIQHALEEQATHDGLTGLPNRKLFLEHLTLAIHRIGRNSPALAVMFCDLDGFKAVNDGLGHEAGDQLLIEVAGRFRECLRDGDVVARFGGDEFCVLLPGVENVEVAQMIAERVMKRIEEPIDLESGEGNVGTSIGLAICTDPVRDPEELLAEADAAMYRAKAKGKRRQQLFDDELRESAALRLELVRDLPGALHRGEFEMEYRPVLSMADGSLVAMEAGLVWMHPTRGALTAGDWVPLAYESNSILALDGIAIQAATSRAGIWNVGRPDGERVTVWVTVGARDLLRGGLAEMISQLIETSEAGPGSFGIEVGLTSIAKHPREAESVLKSLAWVGVRIGLDDFGFSQFAISQLQGFRVETVKLDRRLVASLAKDPDSISAVSSIVQLARGLGLCVQAKGVDSVPQLELLQDLGVHDVQGAIIGAPRDEASAAELLNATPAWDHGAWPVRRLLDGGRLSRSQMMERMMVLRAAARSQAA